ncbi:MAG: hypothetical protein JO331_13775 [Verrucomicrobia bacterium]|nr:hypothetical protein [Verrucomicrobiota bacterium]MBV8970112.1 hypothetical protein [Verrucomicrobiota bacterium]
MEPVHIWQKIAVTVRSKQTPQTQVSVTLFMEDLLSVHLVETPIPRLTAIFRGGEIIIQRTGLERLVEIRQKLLQGDANAFQGVDAECVEANTRSAALE